MDENRITELWNKAVAEIGDCTYPQIITRFAELVAADECEACAAAIRAAALESDDEAEAYGMQMAAGLLDKRSNVERNRDARHHRAAPVDGSVGGDGGNNGSF